MLGRLDPAASLGSQSRSKTMEHEDGVIELGVASIETMGTLLGNGDVAIGQPQPGLTND
jgi:hypothetical protein